MPYPDFRKISKKYWKRTS